MRHSSFNLNMLLLGYMKQRSACRMVKGTVLSLSLDTFLNFVFAEGTENLIARI